MIAALFDDHYEALPTWREAGLTGLTCIHVDAHLDVSADGFTEQSLAGIAKARNREELAAFRDNPRLPWGGLHCGNYLYPALLDGTVTTLIWVVPREFGEGSFLPTARQTLQSWVDLTLSEYSGLKLVNGAVEGTLAGRRLVVCNCDNMPRLSDDEASRVALDIDVDYFVRVKDDRMWQTPHELWQCLALSQLRPLALTVATSCDGGYTPLSHRFLGDVCLRVFGGEPEAWKEETLEFQKAFETGLPPLESEKPRALVGSAMGAIAALAGDQAESAEAGSAAPPEVVEARPDAPPPPPESAEELAAKRKEALEGLLSRCPDRLKPSVLCALERFDEAAALDSSYTPCVRDTAGRLFQQRRFAEALACLDDLKESGADSGFMLVFLAFGNSQVDLSLEQIGKLLTYPGLTERDTARLLALQGEILGHDQPKKAIEVLRRALKIEPNRALPHHLQAQYLRRTGDREAAAKVLRKALRLARGKVSSLPMLLDASRLYDELGQKALARATRRELEEADVTGYYAIQSVLDTTR